MTPLPTLRQLQFFSALVRRRSFSKAAEDCLVSQSTLSSAIKELETLLDCALVDRSSRAFGLTPAGEDVAARADHLLALAEDLARAAAERGPLEGPFHLGVIPTIAPFVLPKAALRLKKEFPKLELYLREDLTDALIALLGAGVLDAALLALPYDVPGAEIIAIGEDPFWFASVKDHPLASDKKISLQALSKAQLMLLEDGHCLRDHAMEACRLHASDVARAFGATSLFTLAQMVKAGLGATLLPDIAIRAGFAKAAGIAATPLAAPAPARQIALVYRRGSGRGEEAQAVADLLVQQFD